MKLLFITSRYFRPLTEAALQRLGMAQDSLVLEYNDFEHIAQVYAQHAEQYDICFVSGAGARQAICMGCSNIHKPLIHFQVSGNGLHRAILKLAVENQSLDFSRIAVDFLLPLGWGYSVTDYLTIDDFATVLKNTAAQMSSRPEMHPSRLSENIVSSIRKLWQEKKIDMVICQYSSIISELEAMGIPYRCPFIADSQLKQTIEEAVIRLELEQFHENHPAIIQIFPHKSHDMTQEQIAALNFRVKLFMQTNLVECVQQESDRCISVITSLRVLRTLTRGFTECQLSGWLKEDPDFPVAIAYGIGTTVPHAMNNVQLASREAAITGNSFVVDTTGNLIGPLNTGKPQVSSAAAYSDISQVAKRCNLSAMTIHKIIGIIHSTGSDKMTIQDLATHMDTTIRNANRIMLNLCKGNAATPVYTQLSHSRGRPVQVYSINFGISTT